MGMGPMAMRFVYHLSKDAAYPGPGCMFIFAGGLLLGATGCSYALPADQTNSRQRNAHTEMDEVRSIVLDSEDLSTPFLDPLSPVFDDDHESNLRANDSLEGYNDRKADPSTTSRR